MTLPLSLGLSISNIRNLEVGEKLVGDPLTQTLFRRDSWEGRTVWCMYQLWEWRDAESKQQSLVKQCAEKVHSAILELFTANTVDSARFFQLFLPDAASLEQVFTVLKAHSPGLSPFSRLGVDPAALFRQLREKEWKERFGDDVPFSTFYKLSRSEEVSESEEKAIEAFLDSLYGKPLTVDDYHLLFDQVAGEAGGTTKAFETSLAHRCLDTSPLFEWGKHWKQKYKGDVIGSYTIIEHQDKLNDVGFRRFKVHDGSTVIGARSPFMMNVALQEGCSGPIPCANLELLEGGYFAKVEYLWTPSQEELRQAYKIIEDSQWRLLGSCDAMFGVLGNRELRLREPGKWARRR